MSEEIFIRPLRKSDPANHLYTLQRLPDKKGYKKVYKPYGEQGRGFYYVRE